MAAGRSVVFQVQQQSSPDGAHELAHANVTDDYRQIFTHKKHTNMRHYANDAKIKWYQTRIQSRDRRHHQS